MDVSGGKVCDANLPHANAGVVESRGKGGEDECEDGADHVGGPDEPASGCARVDVGCIHIIREDGRNGDELGGHGGRDGHEDEQEHCRAASLAEQGECGVREDQASADVIRGHA